MAAGFDPALCTLFVISRLIRWLELITQVAIEASAVATLAPCLVAVPSSYHDSQFLRSKMYGNGWGAAQGSAVRAAIEPARTPDKNRLAIARGSLGATVNSQQCSDS